MSISTNSFPRTVRRERLPAEALSAGRSRRRFCTCKKKRE